MSLRDVAGSHDREHNQGEDETALGDEAIIGQTALENRTRSSIGSTNVWCRILRTPSNPRRR